MNTKDSTKDEAREVRENDEARKLLVDGKNRKNNGTRKVNKLWLWFGVIILVFILLYWIFGIGTLQDLLGISNG